MPILLQQLKLLPTGQLALVALLAALCGALLLTPLVRVLATRFGVLVHPDARRLHARPTALWGGIVIFFAVALAALLWRQPTLSDFRQLAPSGDLSDVQRTAQITHLSAYFFGCGFLMMLLGLADDKWELSPLLKLCGQILIASLLWHGGFRIVTLPFSSGLEALSAPASWALTTLWLLGLTNGVNLIDGVDGLASGVCAIAAGSLCLIELSKNATWAATASAAVCGASLGFLWWNKPPARIFLGEGASLLGFWLAAIALAAAAKTAAATTLALPLLVMGVPVVDTAWAIVRRTLAHQPPWKADRGHLHHRLLARGLSPQKTVLVIYAISTLLGLSAVVWATRG